LVTVQPHARIQSAARLKKNLTQRVVCVGADMHPPTVLQVATKQGYTVEDLEDPAVRKAVVDDAFALKMKQLLDARTPWVRRRWR